MGIFRTLDEDYDLFSIENQIKMLKNYVDSKIRSSDDLNLIHNGNILHKLTPEEYKFCDEHCINVGVDIKEYTWVPFLILNTNYSDIKEVIETIKNFNELTIQYETPRGEILGRDSLYIIIKEDVEYPSWWSLPVPLKKYKDIVPEILRPLYTAL